MSVVIFILVLSFLVIIHELGHFLAAKWAKIKVEEFGLGYPPKALKLFTWWKTEFSLNWIPFGGFVRMDGEDGPASEAVSTSGNKDTDKEKADEAPFYARPVWKRLVVILAGATVNFVFGILAFALVFSIGGIPQVTDDARPRIGGVSPTSTVFEAGVPSNVEIVAFKQAEVITPIATRDDVRAYALANQGNTVTMVTTGVCAENESTCDSTRQEFTFRVRSQSEITSREGLLGIFFAPVIEMKFYPWYEMPFRGMWYGLQQAFGFSQFILSILGTMVTDLFRGVLPSDVAGPVGIADQFQSSGVVQQGWLTVISFMGMLSVNLAVMNILPIPALDGGRAVFLLIEKVVGRKAIEKIEQYANTGGFALLVSLLLLITVRDVIRIVTRLW